MSSENKVYIYSCRAHIPFILFEHWWFVIKEHGRHERWEVISKKNIHNPELGYIRHSTKKPFAGIMTLPFLKSHRWKSHKVAEFSGEEAKKIITVIKTTPKTYTKRHKYNLLTSNCNTYIKWVLNQSNVKTIKFPIKAFG